MDVGERILAAVAPVFAEQGFDGATTRTLAAAAGVNVATLAYHFGDKQGLYDALVDRTYAQLLTVELPADPTVDTRERLRAMVRRLWAFVRGHRQEVQVLLRHVLERRHLPPAVAARWLPAILERVQGALAALELTPDPRTRLALVSLNHLLARYAVGDAEDLRMLTGVADPDAAVGDHLADVAVRLLFTEP